MTKRTMKVLVLGDVPESDGLFERRMFVDDLPTSGSRVPDPEQFRSALEAADNYDVIVVDLEPHGLEVVDEVREYRPMNPVIAVASDENIELVLEALRRGLEDYVLRTGEPAQTSDLLAETIRIQLKRYVEPPEMDRSSADRIFRYAHFYNVAEPFLS